MDEVRARALQAQLVENGRTIRGWSVGALIDNGKSAAVFKATKDGLPGALKVFDRELIARFGGGVQLERIQRELRIRDSPHENVVQILDGGYDEDSDLYFVVMEYLPGDNLAKQLGKIELRMIPALITQLAAAARHLESLGLVHRDIKPSNIIWRDDQTLKLLDLGVLGPFGEIGRLTDVDSKEFIGTLQYSPPEYLLRVERSESLDAWRAINFYQIGAVLHDLIMGKPIFNEFNPFARLVNAVQHETPLMQNGSVPMHIVELARKCLLKDPALRLTLVNWESFQDLQKDNRSSAKERVTNRLILTAATNGEVAPIDSDRQRASLSTEISADMRIAIRSIRADSSVFPPIRHATRTENGLDVQFAESARHGLPDGLLIVVRWNVLDPGERVVELTGRLGGQDQQFETTFFKGVVDKAAMYLALEELVYTMLDAAQAA